MVRPSQERATLALTDAQSTAIGDGTDVGDDGVDYDGGGTNPDSGPITPPAANVVEVVADSSTWDKVLDWSVSVVWDITLGANLTGIVFANPPPAGLDAKMEVTYRQPASGGPYTLAQPAEADWQDTDGTGGGPEPTMPTADESVLVVVFDVRDGGTSYGGTYDSAGGALALDDLTDVDTSGVSDGDLIAYDSGTSTWLAVAPPSGSVPSGTDPGDILVWDGDSWEILPVGADGEIIYADSGEALGLLWDAPPSPGGGGTDPIEVMFGTPDSAYEFDSSSLSGWTNLGSPDVQDADTSVPGHLYIKDNEAGAAAMGIYRTAPSMPFTAICKVNGTLRANYNSAGLLLGSSDPSGSRSAIVYFGQADSGLRAGMAKLNNRTSFDAVNDEMYRTYIDGVGYLAMVVNSSSNVDAYWSKDGYVWLRIAAAADPSLTVANIGVFMFAVNSGGMAVAWDFLRLWNSALTFPYG